MLNEISHSTVAISKLLSANDTGETGGHQAGILIPKKGEILSFFPNLGIETKNPRCKLKFHDTSGDDWNFMFIYYNNKFFDGTRNEFRLTGMTSYIGQNDLKVGDTIILSREDDGRYLIKYERVVDNRDSPSKLRLGNSWKVVKI